MMIERLWFRWFFVATLSLFCVSCGDSKMKAQRANCTAPPTIDGQPVVTLKNGMKFRIGVGRVEWEIDCQTAHHFLFDFNYSDGKPLTTVPQGGETTSAFFAEVSVSELRPDEQQHAGSRIRRSVRDDYESWQFKPALRHGTYPIVLYPRTDKDAPDRAAPWELWGDVPYRYDLMKWGLIGTSDPDSSDAGPYLVRCPISLPQGRTSVADMQRGVFVGGSSCNTGFLITRGERQAYVAMWVWGEQALPHLPQMVNQARIYFESLIVE